MERHNALKNVLPPDAREIFLTFDLDWAADFVMEPLLDFLEEKDVTATIFITHDTALLPRIRANKRLEPGIHPNYNSLLTGGEGEGGNAHDIVARLTRLVPEAKSVRAHSLGGSSRIMDIYRAHGLSHNSDMWLPLESGITAKPFLHHSGLTMMPFLWIDDGHCARSAPAWDARKYLAGPGLKVFDFHPIHIYLNSADTMAYEAARPFHKDAGRLPGYVSSDRERGVAVFLENLITTAVDEGFVFKKMCEAKI